MKKLYEIEIVGAAMFVYDILQKAIEIVISRDATILEIGQSEIADKNGNTQILLTLSYRHDHSINIRP
jgi:hypothetical protein